jgi:hypothetical protein
VLRGGYFVAICVFGLPLLSATTSYSSTLESSSRAQDSGSEVKRLKLQLMCIQVYWSRDYYLLPVVYYSYNNNRKSINFWHYWNTGIVLGSTGVCLKRRNVLSVTRISFQIVTTTNEISFLTIQQTVRHGG